MAQAKSLRDSADKLNSDEFIYFMLSADDVETNTRFANEHTNNAFVILSDPEKTTIEAYGASFGAGFAKRWTFYIDPEGNVAKIDTSVKPVTAADAMIDTLRELGLPVAD